MAAEGTGRFAVGVGFPGVHGRQPGFGAVAEQHQNECHAHAGLVELRRLAHQVRPVQPGQAFGARELVARVVSEDGAEEGHRQAYAADHGVFPCGFERGHVAVEGDQENGGERGEFDGRPHDAEVIRQGHQEHGKHQQGRQDVVHAQFGGCTVAARLVIECAAGFVFAEVAHGVDCARQGHGRVEQDDQRAQRIGVQETVPQGDGAEAQYFRRHRQSQQKREGEGGDVDGFQCRAPARHGREGARGAGNQRNRQQKGQKTHPRSLRRRLTSMDSKVSRMR